jgi:hypothetical protein
MERKFSILGEEIVISPKMELMIRLQTGYRLTVEKCTKSLEQEYSSLFKCFEDFLGEHGLIELALVSIGEMVEYTINVLKEFRIDIETDKGGQFSRHINKLKISNVINEFENMYNTLMEVKNQSRNIREMRKETSPRFEGFGFGITGAIKGAIKAEIANMGLDAIHSIANSLGNARTEHQVRTAMDKVYNDPNTKKSILEILYNDLISFYFLARDIINDSLPYSQRIYNYSEFDSESADGLYLKITNTDTYIENYKEHINFMLQAYGGSGQYTKQDAKQDLEEFYKELNESSREQDIKEILRKFPLKYQFYELYFTYVDQVDRDIIPYANLCGFDVINLIKKRYGTRE